MLCARFGGVLDTPTMAQEQPSVLGINPFRKLLCAYACPWKHPHGGQIVDDLSGMSFKEDLYDLAHVYRVRSLRSA